MHPFHMLGVSVCLAVPLSRHCTVRLSPVRLVRETHESESLDYGYKFGQEEETYNIVAAHGYFGPPDLQYASFDNSRSLHFCSRLGGWWGIGSRPWASGTRPLTSTGFNFKPVGARFPGPGVDTLGPTCSTAPDLGFEVMHGTQRHKLPA